MWEEGKEISSITSTTVFIKENEIMHEMMPFYNSSIMSDLLKTLYSKLENESFHCNSIKT